MNKKSDTTLEYHQFFHIHVNLYLHYDQFHKWSLYMYRVTNLNYIVNSNVIFTWVVKMSSTWPCQFLYELYYKGSNFGVCEILVCSFLLVPIWKKYKNRLTKQQNILQTNTKVFLKLLYVLHSIYFQKWNYVFDFPWMRVDNFRFVNLFYIYIFLLFSNI